MNKGYHTSVGVSQHNTCKVAPSKITRFLTWAKHSCSKLSGFLRPSTVCSNAVRSKLSVKGCSSVHRCRVHHKMPSPQCRWIRLNVPCADFAARGRSGQQGRELHWAAPVKFAAVRSSPWLEAGPTSPDKPTHNTQDKRPHSKQPTNQNTKDKAPQPKRSRQKRVEGEPSRTTVIE